jgi:hypothetical protein
MSAVATKKIGADLDQQLSFPAMFEEAYAELRLPTKFYPTAPLGEADLPAGTDLQSQWHEQKRLDAHRSAMNGVRDTKRATARALVSHAGYFGMPKAVLGQRIFANPSLGSGQADIYAARRTAPDSEEAPFHCVGGLSGGVLRSKEGQEFGKKLLADRLRQLNAIDVAKQEQMMGVPMGTIAEPPFAPAPGLVEAESPEMIKLAGLLTNLQNAVSGYGTGVSKLDISDYTELVSLIVRLAPRMSREVLEDLMAQLDVTVEALEGYEEDEEDSGVFLNYLRDNLPKLRRYVAGMLRGVNAPSVEVIDEAGKTKSSLVPAVETMSGKEKEALSRNLVRSLALTKKPAEKLLQRKTIEPGPEVAALAQQQPAAALPVAPAQRAARGVALPADGPYTRAQLEAASRANIYNTVKGRIAGLSALGKAAMINRILAVQGGEPGGAAAQQPQPAGANVGRGKAPKARRVHTIARMSDDFTPNAATREETEAAEAKANAGVYRLGTRFDLSGPQKFAEQGSLGFYGEVNPKFTGITLNEARVGKPDDAMAMLAAKTREAAPPVGLETPAAAVGKGRHMKKGGSGRRGRAESTESTSGAAEDTGAHEARAATAAEQARARQEHEAEVRARAFARRREMGTCASQASRSMKYCGRGEEDGLDEIKAEIAQRVSKKGGAKKAAPKKWIQEAVKGMKKGAFTKQALARDETPKEYAKEVLAHPGKHTVKTRRRAQFIKNIMKE